ncbi:MAG: hypothetical protein ACI4FZ_01635 [Lachnospiraceae bacterium]
MNQIYQFEQINPPVVTEAMLQSKLEKRRLERQTTLLALGAILSQICILILAGFLYPVSAALTAVCLAYIIISVTGGTVIALIFSYQRRNFICRV